MLTNLQKAFPDFDNTLLFTKVLQKLRPLGFKDFSDKNQELPCIWLRNDNDTKISIYINHDKNPLPYEPLPYEPLPYEVYNDIEFMFESENYGEMFVHKAFSKLEIDDLVELCKSHLES
jgi:hypothetical protein